MALASQTARTPIVSRASSRRWRRKRRRGRRRGRVVIAGALGAGLVVLFLWRPWSGAPSEAQASAPGEQEEARTAQDDPAQSVGLAATNALRETTQETPTIRMGDAQDRVEPAPQRAAAAEPSPETAPRGAQPEPTRTALAPETLPAPRETTPSAPSSSSSPVEVRTLLTRGAAAQEQGRLVEARTLFNRALRDPRTSERDRALLRDALGEISRTLTFSPEVVEGDPLAETYVIRSGDTLSKITARQNLEVDWRFIQRINDIADPRRIRVGQTIKLVRGPFHAVIHKRDHRLDLFADLPESVGGERLFIASYPVGLGEYDSTPPGKWVVRDDSRLINPPWTNPRTGEHYSADNPENPIGERWVGLRGVDEFTNQISGIGIHGTIEPDSIGSNTSMGCVRMLPEHVEVTYEMLVSGVSTVEIKP